jgi:chromosome segregation ATPase
MKNFLLLLFIVLFVGAGVTGWYFRGLHQNALIELAEAQGRNAALEEQAVTLRAERDAAQARAIQAGDALAERDARLAETQKRYEEIQEHIKSMAAELFAAKQSFVGCQKARNELEKARDTQEQNPPRLGGG